MSESDQEDPPTREAEGRSYFTYGKYGRALKARRYRDRDTVLRISYERWLWALVCSLLAGFLGIVYARNSGHWWMLYFFSIAITTHIVMVLVYVFPCGHNPFGNALARHWEPFEVFLDAATKNI